MVVAFTLLKYKPAYKVTINEEIVGYITNKEQYVRVGTLQEIIVFLGLSARAIDSAVKRGTRLCNRYSLVYLYTEKV